MKDCIACAEEIKEKAILCKHCGTRQDDEAFVGGSVDEVPPILDFRDAQFSEEVTNWATSFKLQAFYAADESEEAPTQVKAAGPRRVWTILDSLDDGGVFASSKLLEDGGRHMIVGWLVAGRDSESEDHYVQLVEREDCEACDAEGCDDCNESGLIETHLIKGLDAIAAGF